MKKITTGLKKITFDKIKDYFDTDWAHSDKPCQVMILVSSEDQTGVLEAIEIIKQDIEEHSKPLNSNQVYGNFTLEVSRIKWKNG